MFTPAVQAALWLAIGLLWFAKDSPKGRLFRLPSVLLCVAGLLQCCIELFCLQGPAKGVVLALAGSAGLASLSLLLSRWRRFRQLEPLQYRSDGATR